MIFSQLRKNEREKEGMIRRSTLESCDGQRQQRLRLRGREIDVRNGLGGASVTD